MVMPPGNQLTARFDVYCRHLLINLVFAPLAKPNSEMS